MKYCTYENCNKPLTLMWGMKYYICTLSQSVCVSLRASTTLTSCGRSRYKLWVLFARHMRFYHIQVSVKEMWYCLWLIFSIDAGLTWKTIKRIHKTRLSSPCLPAVRISFTLATLLIFSHFTWCEEHQQIPPHRFIHSFIPSLMFNWQLYSVCVSVCVYI